VKGSLSIAAKAEPFGCPHLREDLLAGVVYFCSCSLIRDLVREPRTIRRWKTGESPVPKVEEEWLAEKAKVSHKRSE
jgi:hypothetical protein